jgi:arylsulfatase A-like enzyme
MKTLGTILVAICIFLALFLGSIFLSIRLSGIDTKPVEDTAEQRIPDRSGTIPYIDQLPSITDYHYHADIQNVILIVIDTLRLERLGCYGYYLDTSPNIDAFAERSVVFENAYTPQSITTPAFTALFTGIHPSISGVRDLNQRWPPNLHSLVERFQRNGFRTTGVGAAIPVKPELGFDRGMDDYRCEHFEGRAAYGWEQIAEVNNILGIVELDNGDSVRIRENAEIPTFLMVHFWEPHSPMTAPSTVMDELGLWHSYSGPADGSIPMYLEYNAGERSMSIDDLQRVSDLYDAEVRYTDEYIRGLLTNLERHGLFNNSLIVLMADHGETLGENHRICHGLTSQHEIHIPLIFHFPHDLGAGKRIEGFVDITDIMPTIMDICNIPVPEDINGRSRLGMIENPGTPGREYVVSIIGWKLSYLVWDGVWRREVDFNPLIQGYDTELYVNPQDWETLRSLGYIN